MGGHLFEDHEVAEIWQGDEHPPLAPLLLFPPQHLVRPCGLNHLSRPPQSLTAIVVIDPSTLVIFLSHAVVEGRLAPVHDVCATDADALPEELRLGRDK